MAMKLFFFLKQYLSACFYCQNFLLKTQETNVRVVIVIIVQYHTTLHKFTVADSRAVVDNDFDENEKNRRINPRTILVALRFLASVLHPHTGCRARVRTHTCCTHSLSFDCSLSRAEKKVILVFLVLLAPTTFSSTYWSLSCCFASCSSCTH